MKRPYYISLTPLLPWRQAPAPMDWKAWFGRGGPLRLEIGCGNGERLVKRALDEPGTNFIGIDRSWPALQRALRKLHLAGAKNICLIQAPAALALARLFEPGLITAWEALFPRPWPRKRDAQHRLLSRRFLTILNSRLAPGAGGRMVTDDERYLDWALGQVPEPGFTAERRQRQAGLGTKYERIWQAKGRSFYELSLIKTADLHWPLWEDNKLRHHILQAFDPDAFPLGEHPGEYFVSFKDLVYDPKKQKALIRALVVEDNLKQSLLLEVARAGDGWRLRVAPGCGMLPTQGVWHCLELCQRLAGG